MERTPLRNGENLNRAYLHLAELRERSAPTTSCFSVRIHAPARGAYIGSYVCAGCSVNLRTAPWTPGRFFGGPGVADIKSNFGATRGWEPQILGDALLAGWNLLCAVDDSKHVDLIRLDVVDDSKGPF